MKFLQGKMHSTFSCKSLILCRMTKWTFVIEWEYWADEKWALQCLKRLYRGGGVLKIHSLICSTRHLIWKQMVEAQRKSKQQSCLHNEKKQAFRSAFQCQTVSIFRYNYNKRRKEHTEDMPCYFCGHFF